MKSTLFTASCNLFKAVQIFLKSGMIKDFHDRLLIFKITQF